MKMPLYIVLRCAEPLVSKVRYVFDTLLMAHGVPVVYSPEPPDTGPWVLYASSLETAGTSERRLSVAHCPDSWKLFSGHTDVQAAADCQGVPTVLPETLPGFDVSFDLAANAFYFLSSWSERVGAERGQTRKLYANSKVGQLDIPQDIVDRYLALLVDHLNTLCDRLTLARWGARPWPCGARFAFVLSHDIDFLPIGTMDILRQGAKSVMRHLVRQRDPGDAWRAAWRLLRAVAAGRDPYGCVPEILEREKQLGVRSSFQIAVGHRHRSDVNYRIEDDRVRDYLLAIGKVGFELCLHGSYRSAENPDWYIEEVDLLSRRLARPRGSRQHYLSFDYDHLFCAQEKAGIEYDMSMGYPDRSGPRAGFSYPYFPFCLAENRPYRVLQISLFLMDVTLRSYMALKGARAWAEVRRVVDDVSRKRGCASVVWHPIVFGGARDPGYDRLFWDMVDRVRELRGLATDGRTINTFWRTEAAGYSSFG
jgi:hypothetical protein